MIDYNDQQNQLFKMNLLSAITQTRSQQTQNKCTLKSTLSIACFFSKYVSHSINFANYALYLNSVSPFLRLNRIIINCF